MSTTTGQTQAGACVFRVSDRYAAAVDLSRASAHTSGRLDRDTGANPDDPGAVTVAETPDDVERVLAAHGRGR